MDSLLSIPSSVGIILSIGCPTSQSLWNARFLLLQCSVFRNLIGPLLSLYTSKFIRRRRGLKRKKYDHNFGWLFHSVAEKQIGWSSVVDQKVTWCSTYFWKNSSLCLWFFMSVVLLFCFYRWPQKTIFSAKRNHYCSLNNHIKWQCLKEVILFGS